MVRVRRKGMTLCIFSGIALTSRAIVINHLAKLMQYENQPEHTGRTPKCNKIVSNELKCMTNYKTILEGWGWK